MLHTPCTRLVLHLLILNAQLHMRRDDISAHILLLVTKHPAVAGGSLPAIIAGKAESSWRGSPFHVSSWTGGPFANCNGTGSPWHRTGNPWHSMTAISKCPGSSWRRSPFTRCSWSTWGIAIGRRRSSSWRRSPSASCSGSPWCSIVIWTLAGKSDLIVALISNRAII